MTTNEYRKQLEEKNDEYKNDLINATNIIAHVYATLQIQPSWTYWASIDYTIYQEDLSSQELYDRYQVLRNTICGVLPLSFGLDRITAHYIDKATVVYQAMDTHLNIEIFLEIPGENLSFWTGKEGCVIKEQQRTNYTISCPIEK